MVLKKISLALCMVFFVAPCLFAEDTDVFNLGEIVVSGDEGVRISSTSQISSYDIETKDAQTVDEALDFVPGVRLTVGQKNEPYIMIRGFNQDDVLVLLDGIPISSPNYGYVDLNQVPVESIAKIKVIKGAVSPLYGANAIGGVVNIISKSPKEKPFLEVSNSFGENRTRYQVLNYGAKSDGVSLWLSGSRRVSDGFELSGDFKESRNEDGGLRDNSQYEENALSLKLGLEKFDRHNPTVLFNYIDNEKGIPAHISSSRPRYWKFTEWKRWMVALADEYAITEDLSIKGRIFYDKYDNTINAYDDATYTTQNTGSAWTSIYDEYALGSSIYVDYDLNDTHTLKAAVNLKKDVHKEQDDSGDPWEDYEVRTYSLGLEDEVKVNDRLSLLCGVSFDTFDQIRTANASNQMGDNTYTFNPSFTANYAFNPGTSIYSSVSKRTNFPTITQLYSNTSGNPNLSEQRNINYEIGAKHAFSKGTGLKISYFYNDVKDLIDRVSRNDLYLNTYKAVFEGVEADIDASLGNGFFARAGYTYLDATDKDPGLLGRSEKELPNIPKHKTDMELRYVSSFGLSCSLLSSYHGKRYFYDSNNAQNKMGGYFLWNAKVSQKLNKNWKGSVSVENIFDRNYQEEEGYPQPGRTLLFTISAQF